MDVPTKHRRLSITVDPELSEALARARSVLPADVADATWCATSPCGARRPSRAEFGAPVLAGQILGTPLVAMELVFDIPVTDLLIAAAAAARGAGVLHYDHHFDRLSEVLGFESRWLLEPGTA